MSDGLPVDCVLLVVEGEGHKGGLSELGQGCVGCSKATGFDEKLNIIQHGGGQTCVLTSIVIFDRSQRKNKLR